MMSHFLSYCLCWISLEWILPSFENIIEEYDGKRLIHGGEAERGDFVEHLEGLLNIIK